MPMPVKYKESGKWLRANPTVASLKRGPWWRMYGDPVLNRLEERVISANQNLKAALARYDEARALVGVAQSAYYPSALGVVNGNRQKQSGTAANQFQHSIFNDFLLAINFNYEVDLFGRVRNSVVAAKANAVASAADLAAIDLSLHAELAADYFALRGDDIAQRILDQTVVAYEKALYLTRKRYQGGAAPIADVDQAQYQLDNAKTLAADVRLQRAQLEHAIAVLIGESPSTFNLPATVVKFASVTITPNLPSGLLERRPDIAEAEYLVQSANANIGVVRAGFFPDINLAAVIGYESAALSRLIRGPSLLWSLGPTTASALLNNGSMPLVTQLIFDGGKTISLTKQACAQYYEAVAKYRQTVLVAFQEVEDSLVAVRRLDQEKKSQAAATAAANRSLAQAWYRYRGGLTTYLDVVIWQDQALQAQLSDINIKTRRQVASVQLIKALGGGWEQHDLRC